MTWAGVQSLAGVLAVAAAAVGLPALVLFVVKERRKNSAASEVAERTVDADVVVKDTAADDARLLHAIAAFDAERASFERQLRDRDAEITRQRGEITYKDSLLEHQGEMLVRLRAQVEDLLARLAEATRELHGVRLELAQMTAEGEGPVLA